MNLYLLRHGVAAEPTASTLAHDSERALTAKGKRKLWKSATALEQMGLEFNLILSSPYVRARQTAEIIAEALNARNQLELSAALSPTGRTRELISFLNELEPAPQEVLLVGHEPYLSELMSLLLSGDSRMAINLKKGGLCKLSAAPLKHGRCASLEWFLTPKQLGALG